MLGSDKEFVVNEARTHGPGQCTDVQVQRPLGYPGTPSHDISLSLVQNLPFVEVSARIPHLLNGILANWFYNFDTWMGPVPLTLFSS